MANGRFLTIVSSSLLLLKLLWVREMCGHHAICGVYCTGAQGQHAVTARTSKSERHNQIKSFIQTPSPWGYSWENSIQISGNISQPSPCTDHDQCQGRLKLMNRHSIGTKSRILWGWALGRINTCGYLINPLQRPVCVQIWLAKVIIEDKGVFVKILCYGASFLCSL